MCGRFGLIKLSELDHARFGVAEWPPSEARYNIAPGSDVLAVAEAGGRRAAGWLRWGLIRPNGPGIVVNVRAEGLFTNRLLEGAGETRRCLIPATVFYEWQPRSGTNTKQPFAVAARDGSTLALGAIYLSAQRSEATGGRSTCAVLTTSPNALMAPIHSRMPVIIGPDDIGAWMNRETSVADVKALMQSYPADAMRAWPISARVNRTSEDDADLITIVEAPTTG